VAQIPLCCVNRLRTYLMFPPSKAAYSGNILVVIFYFSRQFCSFFGVIGSRAPSFNTVSRFLTLPGLLDPFPGRLQNQGKETLPAEQG
jgi:hypothetical protein